MKRGYRDDDEEDPTVEDLETNVVGREEFTTTWTEGRGRLVGK